MKYINSVVIKLWLTILFIVTTVLIILSVALMSFINAYLMSESALTLKQQAEKVELVLMSRHDKSDAMNYVKELIENPAGLILITNKQDKNMSVEDPLKALMLKEIKKNKAFDDVYKKDETVVQSIEVDYQGSKHE
ncbi:MAG: two-component sensor histidine kinase, partial [Macrococcus canis]|nr:two-component sensor histidine kinase [Macrococcus canis]